MTPVDPGPVSSLNTGRLPAYARIDVRATFRPGGPNGRWLLYGEIINVTNRDNTPAFEYLIAFDPETGAPALKRRAESGIPFLPTLGVRVRF